MNKKEFISRTAELLRQKNIKKSVPGRKEVLHITDDNGNKSDFAVKTSDKTIIFNIDDLTAIFDAFIYIAEDAVKHGEEVAIHGFGALGVRYRLERSTLHPDTGKPCIVEGRYVPKFVAGKNLKTAAKIFELSLNENQKDIPEPYEDDVDGDE